MTKRNLKETMDKILETMYQDYNDIYKTKEDLVKDVNEVLIKYARKQIIK